jgi:hypothetical protein
MGWNTAQGKCRYQNNPALTSRLWTEQQSAASFLHALQQGLAPSPSTSRRSHTIPGQHTKGLVAQTPMSQAGKPHKRASAGGWGDSTRCPQLWTGSTMGTWRRWHCRAGGLEAACTHPALWEALDAKNVGTDALEEAAIECSDRSHLLGCLRKLAADRWPSKWNRTTMSAQCSHLGLVPGDSDGF